MTLIRPNDAYFGPKVSKVQQKSIYIGARVRGACLVFIQNTTAEEYDCQYGYYMASCDSTEPETICSTTRSGDYHRVLPEPEVTTPAPTRPNSTITSFEDCNNGWLYDGDRSCVKLFTTPLTWHDAQEKCNNLSARLVTSQESKYTYILEDYFVSTLLLTWVK